MIKIIVSDSSAIIDIAKVRLVEHLLRLPYEFIIPDTLFEDELIKLSNYKKQDLLDLGFRLGTLDGKGIARVEEYFSTYSGPSLNDFVALTIAETKKDSLLLTGDMKLRKIAENKLIITRGVLWAFDEINNNGTAGIKELLIALQIWQEDENVWLPKAEIQKRIRALSKRQ